MLYSEVNQIYLYIYPLFFGFPFPGGSDNKESACNAGHPDSISGSERSPGEGNGYPLQYSCLENPMDRLLWSSWAHEESDMTFAFLFGSPQSIE